MRTRTNPDKRAMDAMLGVCGPMKAQALAETIGKLGGRSGSDPMAQLFDYGAVINETHLRGAYLNALVTFEERTNIAHTVAIETLLFAAMTRQISVAVGRLGAKPGRKLVLMCGDRTAYKRFARIVGGCSAFSVSRAHERSAAGPLGVVGECTPEAVLMAMTMARLRD